MESGFNKQRLKTKEEVGKKMERKTASGLTMKDVAVKVVEGAMISDEVMEILQIARQTLMKVPWDVLPYIIKTFTDASPRRLYAKELVIQYLADITEKRLVGMEMIRKARS
ncbi:MAG: hypothetical protein ACRD5H_00720 [Nitrososphaerales archaeon]